MRSISLVITLLCGCFGGASLGPGDGGVDDGVDGLAQATGSDDVWIAPLSGCCEEGDDVEEMVGEGMGMDTDAATGGMAGAMGGSEVPCDSCGGGGRGDGDGDDGDAAVGDGDGDGDGDGECAAAPACATLADCTARPGTTCVDIGAPQGYGCFPSACDGDGEPESCEAAGITPGGPVGLNALYGANTSSGVVNAAASCIGAAEGNAHRVIAPSTGRMMVAVEGAADCGPGLALYVLGGTCGWELGCDVGVLPSVSFDAVEGVEYVFGVGHETIACPYQFRVTSL